MEGAAQELEDVVERVVVGQREEAYLAGAVRRRDLYLFDRLSLLLDCRRPARNLRLAVVVESLPESYAKDSREVLRLAALQLEDALAEQHEERCADENGGTNEKRDAEERLLEVEFAFDYLGAVDTHHREACPDAGERNEEKRQRGNLLVRDRRSALGVHRIRLDP